MLILRRILQSLRIFVCHLMWLIPNLLRISCKSLLSVVLNTTFNNNFSVLSFEKYNMVCQKLVVIFVIFAVSWGFENPLLLEGYSGSPRVVLNSNGSELERQVIIACNGFFGPPGGQSTREKESNVPLPLDERNCLLGCQYFCFRIIQDSNPQQQRYFYPEKVFNYFSTYTNATDGIANDMVVKFQKCKDEADYREYKLMRKLSLPNECYFFRIFYNCVAGIEVYHFDGKLF